MEQLNFENDKNSLSRFSDFACFDTPRADSHPLDAALRTLNTDGLQIGIKAAACAIVCMRDIVAELWCLIADCASFSHSNYYLRMDENAETVS